MGISSGGGKGGGKGGDFQKYYSHYMPDVKNWTNRDEVRDAFVKKYAGSYTDYAKKHSKSADTNINLNSEDSKKESDKYTKYYSKFVPDVKNWSNREQVNDAFVSKYGGSYTKGTDKKQATSESNAVHLYATAPSSDKATNTSSSSMPESTQSLAVSQDSVDAQTVSL